MPRAERHATAVWEGSSARGSGSLSGETGAFSGLPYSEPARIGAPHGETSPEELLAAAHAACYAMSLAAELTRAKAPPERLEVRATVAIDEVPGRGHRVVESALRVRVRADVAGATLQELAAVADDACPFSNLVRASARVRIAVDRDQES